MADTLRSRDIARAVLLRERILGCLHAAPSPMSRKELAEWPSIAELYAKPLIQQKVIVQIRALARRGEIDHTERMRASNNCWFIKRAADLPLGTPEAFLAPLHIEIDKQAHTLTLTFEGVHITIKVL